MSDKISSGDYRAQQERLVGEGGKKNRELLQNVQRIADAKGVTIAQLVLAWVMAQSWRLNGAGIVPIPGTTKEKNLMSNVGSLDIELTPEDIEALEAAVPQDAIVGGRYEANHVTWEKDKNRELTPGEARELGL